MENGVETKTKTTQNHIISYRLYEKKNEEGISEYISFIRKVPIMC